MNLEPINKATRLIADARAALEEAREPQQHKPKVGEDAELLEKAIHLLDWAVENLTELRHQRYLQNRGGSK